MGTPEETSSVKTREGTQMHSVRHRAGVTARIGRTLAGTLAVGALVAGGSLAVEATPALAVASSNSPCATVNLIVARASTEAPGDGAIGALAEEIQKGVKATVSQQAVNYPAALTPYEPSVTAGDSAIKSQLESEVSKCPSQKIVLLGYSQGAQIVGDVLGGGGGNVPYLGVGDGPASSPASSSATSHVVGVIQYGDPRRVANQSFDVGNDKGATGIFPRPSSQSVSKFASSIQSYCDSGDPFCAKGLNVLAHLDYVQKYDSAADKFIIGRLNSAGIS
jgi:acetylxylan esterase